MTGVSKEAIDSLPAFVQVGKMRIDVINALGRDTVIRDCVGIAIAQYCTNCGLCTGKDESKCEIAGLAKSVGINTV